MKFLKPQNVVASSGIKPGQNIADLGCGSGFYVLAAAKMVGNTGRVLAVDVQDPKLTATKSISLQHNLHNVEVFRADLEKPINLPHGTEDMVIVASILHEVKNREALLKNAYALLKTHGHLLAVDWKLEHSPFGPSMEKRISEHDLRKLLEGMGMKHIKDINGDLYHYAMLFEK